MVRWDDGFHTILVSQGAGFSTRWALPPPLLLLARVASILNTLSGRRGNWADCAQSVPLWLSSQLLSGTRNETPPVLPSGRLCLCFAAITCFCASCFVFFFWLKLRIVVYDWWGCGNMQTQVPGCMLICGTRRLLGLHEKLARLITVLGVRGRGSWVCGFAFH